MRRRLTSTRGPCPCHAGSTEQRIYWRHGHGYCLTCLHSIGVNANGNRATDRQYRRAWQELAGDLAPVNPPIRKDS